ncbi:5-oxoprolinase subunit PxpC [soil metagenome]
MQVMLLRAGYGTTVQDLGRFGWRASGVSVSGALDAHALRVANLLVGNKETAAGLEVALGTVRLRFEDERLVAWCGGDFRTGLPRGRPVLVRAGEEVQWEARENGGRAWLAISGGVAVSPVLGSRSTDARAALGGTLLQDGEVLSLGGAGAPSRRSPDGPAWFAPNEWTNTTPSKRLLRVIRGAECPLFSSAEALLHEPFLVTAASDRMGARLQGAQLHRHHHGDLLSEPVIAGTIQVPPGGDPILLLADCQTIGGYPKIAHVITVDLAGAAQLQAGDVVRFSEVSLGEAHRLLLERERDLAWFRAGLSLMR